MDNEEDEEFGRRVGGEEGGVVVEETWLKSRREVGLKRVNAGSEDAGCRGWPAGGTGGGQRGGGGGARRRRRRRRRAVKVWETVKSCLSVHPPRVLQGELSAVLMQLCLPPLHASLLPMTPLVPSAAAASSSCCSSGCGLTSSRSLIGKCGWGEMG